jgi:hypothetical protein
MGPARLWIAGDPLAVGTAAQAACRRCLGRLQCLRRIRRSSRGCDRVHERVYLALRRDPHPRVGNLGAILEGTSHLSMRARDVAFPGHLPAARSDVHASAVGQNGPLASELLQAPVQRRVDRDVERLGDLRRCRRPILEVAQDPAVTMAHLALGRHHCPESYRGVGSGVCRVLVPVPPSRTAAARPRGTAGTKPNRT